MAIAVVATSGANGDADGTKTSVTLAHNCGASSNRILFVATRDGSTTSTITGVTYADAAMTKYGSGLANTSGYLNLWYKIAPATGSNNIVVSRSGTGTILWVCGVSYSGVLQTGFPDAGGTASADAATSIAKTITTVKNNCWWLAAHFNRTTNSTVGAGTTDRVGTSYGLKIGDSNAAVAIGNVTSNFSSSSTDLRTIMVSFAPAPELGGNPMFFSSGGLVLG
jgi:hypothetical protein